MQTTPKIQRALKTGGLSPRSVAKAERQIARLYAGVIGEIKARPLASPVAAPASRTATR